MRLEVKDLKEYANLIIYIATILMIISILTLLSARRPKISEAIPGRSTTPLSEIRA